MVYKHRLEEKINIFLKSFIFNIGAINKNKSMIQLLADGIGDPEGLKIRCGYFVEITYIFLSQGIGFGMIYMPAVLTVGFYFEKWRALATGLALCGSGVGTFAMAPITEKLNESLGWRGTMLVTAGLSPFNNLTVLKI